MLKVFSEKRKSVGLNCSKLRDQLTSFFKCNGSQNGNGRSRDEPLLEGTASDDLQLGEEILARNKIVPEEIISGNPEKKENTEVRAEETDTIVSEVLEIAVDDTESLTVGITLEVIVEETEEEIEAAMKRMETIQNKQDRFQQKTSAKKKKLEISISAHPSDVEKQKDSMKLRMKEASDEIGWEVEKLKVLGELVGERLAHEKVTKSQLEVLWKSVYQMQEKYRDCFNKVTRQSTELSGLWSQVKIHKDKVEKMETLFKEEVERAGRFKKVAIETNMTLVNTERKLADLVKKNAELEAVVEAMAKKEANSDKLVGELKRENGNLEQKIINLECKIEGMGEAMDLTSKVLMRSSRQKIKASFEAATKASENFPHPDSPGVAKVSPLKEPPPKKAESYEESDTVQALSF